MRPHMFLLPALLATAVILSGCMGGEGNLQVKATDAPGNIDDFSSVMVTVTKIRVHQSGAGGESDSEGNETGVGWTTFDVDANRRTFDLVDLLNGNTTTLLNQSLETGKYSQIRLHVEKAEGTLKEGSTVTVNVPSKTLKIVKPFDIEDGKTTTFTADINVVKTGQGTYSLSPVVGKSMVSGPA